MTSGHVSLDRLNLGRPRRARNGQTKMTLKLKFILMISLFSSLFTGASGCEIIQKFMSNNNSETTPQFDGMLTREIQLSRADGSLLTISVKIADEQAERLAGFQHISPGVIQKSFILFIFAEPKVARFHMQNVQAPLDIAFISSEGSLINIQTMTPGPELYGPLEPFEYALEARAGFFEENGFEEDTARLVIASLRGNQ